MDLATPDLRLSVVIVTWRRPDSVRSCLEHLAEVEAGLHEVIVVDASVDEHTAAVVDAFPFARRLEFTAGAGHMTTARNYALLHVSGDVIAFLDDDAYARPGWAEGLKAAFADSDVSAVVGRTRNPGDGRLNAREPVGRILPNGRLTANFSVDLPAEIDVDHGIGANMAFRREVLARLGGFRDDFLGVGAVREDADMFLRVKAVGGRAVFAPRAVADHVGAPHARGKRFDYRYMFWARHNHVLLLARNYGMGSTLMRRWIRSELGLVLSERSRFPRRAARASMGVAAVVFGYTASWRKARWAALDPCRNDSIGERIRRHLKADSRTNLSQTP